MADAQSDVSAFGISSHRRRNEGVRPSVKPPRIEIELAEDQQQFMPGDFLMCEYRLRAVEGLAIHAIEASVIWIADGKSSEDIGVHFFQRTSKDAITPAMLRRPQRLSTVLPNSPLSYPGVIVNIRWCVRVRMFYGDDLELNHDHEFVLGNAAVPTPKTPNKTDGRDDSDGEVSQTDSQAPTANKTETDGDGGSAANTNTSVNSNASDVSISLRPAT